MRRLLPVSRSQVLSVRASTPLALTLLFGALGCHEGGPAPTEPDGLPAAIGSLTTLTYTQLSASLHACGITADSQTYCWGYNSNGALGDGTLMDRHLPVRVGGDMRSGRSAPTSITPARSTPRTGLGAGR